MMSTNLLSVHAATDLLKSFNRIHLTGVPRPVQWLAAINIVALCVLAVLFLYDLRGTARPILTTGHSYFPAMLTVTVLATGIASTALGIAASRASSWGRVALGSAVIATVLVVMSRLLPELPGRSAWITMGVIIVAMGLLENRRWQPRWLLVQIFALFTPYLFTTIVIILRGNGDLLFAARSLAIVPFAVVAAGTLVIVSATDALHSRHPGVSHWISGTQPRLLILGAILLKFIFIAAFYSGAAGEFFGGEQTRSDRTDDPLSWLHAFLVAAAIYVLVVISERRPLPDTRLGLAAAAIVLASAIDSLGLLVFGLGFAEAGNWIVSNRAGLQLTIVAAISITATIEAQRRGLTTGSALGILAGLWLLPPLTGVLADEADVAVPTFWATPIQIDLVLTILGALVLCSPLSRHVSRRDQLRVLLIPALLIYSAIFLPEEWERSLVKYLLVFGIVWLLVARAPDVAPDPRYQTRVLCAFLGAQLATLVVYYLAFTYPQFKKAIVDTAMYGWVWFAVPLAGVLTARRIIAQVPLGHASSPETLEKAPVARTYPDSSTPP